MRVHYNVGKGYLVPEPVDVGSQLPADPRLRVKKFVSRC